MYQTRFIALLIACFSAELIAAPDADSAREAAPRIVFLGDSLTAGYGIDPEKAYPKRIEEKIRAAGLNYEVVAAGLSGETSAGGLRRVNWILQRPAEILIIALGSNDGLRGIDLSSTRANLQGIIDAARAKHPDVIIVLAGMQMPPNLGEVYTSEFRRLFPELAEANGAALIPFLLDGVGGVPELNLADGIHPNDKGHEIVAETVWRVLQPLLRDS